MAGAGAAVRALVNQRRIWCPRIHAELYHHRVAIPEGAIRTGDDAAMLVDASLFEPRLT